jgi:addiction module RelE/StbE family toxin
VIRWTKRAFQDLKSLHDYISMDHPEAADATAKSIQNGLITAESFPESGRKSRRFKGCRELILSPYIVVYRRKAEAVEVVAIIHGARKWLR